MKNIIVIILLLLLSNNLFSQSNINDSLKYSALNTAKSAFSSRMNYLINKKHSLFLESQNQFKIADSLLLNIINVYPDDINSESYNLIHKGTNKELNKTENDITKLHNGKTSDMKIENKIVKFTEEESKYYTYLLLMLMRIDNF